MFRKAFALMMGASFLAAGAIAQEKPAAKNIIIMIADGWGYNQILCADYYATGEAGTAPYESDAFTLIPVATYAADSPGYDPAQSGDYEYLMKDPNDSAATATALASGVATYNGAIGVDRNHKPVKLITERAHQLGKSAGVITTVLFNHATPAAFSAHDPSRGNYPEIAKQMIYDSDLTVIMGAGHPHFDADGKSVEPVKGDPALDVKGSYGRFGGDQVWEELTTGKAGKDINFDEKPDPWTFIDSREGFQKLMTGDTPDRVFGLIPVEATTQEQRSGDVLAPAFEVPLLETVPTLTEMSLGALNILDKNDAGFFLMIEGGAVDWACHSNQPGRMIEEMVDYNKAVQAVIDWVEKNSSWDETLLVVTGDHECGYVLGLDSNPELKPIVNNGQGTMPGFAFYHKSHTNQLIPAFVKGVGSDLLLSEYKEGEDPKRGPYVHDSAIGKVFFEVLQ